MSHNEGSLTALGGLIRERRKTMGLTQVQLADRLDWGQERISMLENGKYGMPSLPSLARLADALEVPLFTLLQVAGYSTYDTSADGFTRTEETVALQYTLQRLLEINATTLKDALDQASDQLAEAMAADKVDAFIFDPLTRSLVALGTSRTPMGQLQHQSGLGRFPLANRGRAVQVYETGTVFRTGDVQQDPEVPVGVKEVLGVRSMLAVPLRVDRTIQGVLMAASAQPDRFTDEEERFFRAAAHWIGLVAHQAELMEAMRQSVAEESRRVAADEVITAVAHDLRNALTPLKGRLDLLTRRLEGDGRQRDLEHAWEAARSVANIQHMVTRLLDSARLDQGLFSLALQPLDLTGLVEQVADDMRASWDTLEVRAGETLEVEGDPVRLRDVLVNLVTNAIQHSPPGAPIILAAGAEERADGRFTVVSITDAGPGIAPDLLPRLFQRFSPGGESSGLGLGLYLSKRLIEAHGGTLTVDSTPGKGTTFWVTLPCSSELDRVIPTGVQQRDHPLAVAPQPANGHG